MFLSSLASLPANNSEEAKPAAGTYGQTISQSGSLSVVRRKKKKSTGTNSSTNGKIQKCEDRRKYVSSSSTHNGDMIETDRGKARFSAFISIIHVKKNQDPISRPSFL